MSKYRPFGITLIVLIEVLEGLILLSGGLAASIIGKLISGPIFSLLGGLIGGILVIWTLFNFILAYGLWTGKSWARVGAMIFAGLALLRGLVSLPFGLLTLILNGLLLYYLTRPNVRAYFTN